MATDLKKVRELNYDHHRRMTELHDRFVAEGKGAERASVDDESYTTLLRTVPRDRKSVLELGSASGKQWSLLKQYMDSDGQLQGIDLYEPLVLKAQAAGLNVVVGFVEQMTFPSNEYDLVCSRHVMEHLGDLPKGIAEILRVTKPGGYIAHVTPNMLVDDEPAHLNHFDVAGWSTIWRSVGLEIISAERHPFNGGEVHIVGRKPL